MNRSVAIIFLGLLAGCARFEPRPISPAATATGLESRSLDDPRLRSFLETNLHRALPEWPLRSWHFEELTAAAFYYSPSLDVARAQWGVTTAGKKTAAGRPNPTVGVNPQYVLNPESGISPWLATVNLDFPIETAGKRGYRMAQAAHLSEAARLNIASVAWDVRSRVRAALLDYASASQRAALLRQQAAIQEQASQRMEQKLAAGAIASSEVTPFRIALGKSRIDLADATRQRAEARACVADAIGVPLSALTSVELPDGLPDWSTGAGGLASAEARRLALVNRADILASLSEYAASQSALQLEIARQYPNVNLGPGYEFDQGSQKIGFTLGVELPILNQNQGPIAEAKAKREEAAAKFTAVQARVLGEIERAITAVQASSEQVSAVDALVASQRQQVENLQRQLDAGAIEPLDLINAGIELSIAELGRQDALVKRQQALGQLEDAIQRPLNVPAAALESPTGAEVRKVPAPTPVPATKSRPLRTSKRRERRAPERGLQPAPAPEAQPGRPNASEVNRAP